MKYNYCIIGTGRQGTAAAYDILKFAKVENLLLIDNSEKNLEMCFDKLVSIQNSITIVRKVININDSTTLVKELKEYDIFLSSVPYQYNLMLTKVAIESKTSMVDLGGHTENVIKQLDYHKKAFDNNISIVPDCGMGPGMNVTMALLAMEHLDHAEEVLIWDGGLPQNPIPPWNYSLFFNIKGLTNEYDESAFFLKNGKIEKVPCFEGIEIINFGDNIGELEAAVTSGGLSTMPWTFEGKLNRLENKTLRYIGHWEWMKAYRELGLFSQENIEFNNVKIVPREFYHHLLKPKLDTKDFKDICLMKVVAKGKIDGIISEVEIDSVEKYDSETGFMAMEKWTGWHASIVMQHILDGNVPYGTHSIENAISGKDFYEAALKRKYSINIKINNKKVN